MSKKDAKKENGKDKDARPDKVSITAKYKGDSKKKTYHVYTIDAKDNDHGMVGSIYVPINKAVPKKVSVTLTGNISDTLSQVSQEVQLISCTSN